MKKMISAALLMLAMATTAACGEPDQPDDSNQVDDTEDTSAEAQLAEARARIDLVFYEAELFSCLCEESADGVEPADTCPDDDEVETPDVETDAACVLALIDAEPPPEGDLSPYASCVEATVAAFEDCQDDPDLQFCSEEIEAERVACFEAAQGQGAGCDTSHAEFAEWFETIEEDVIVECGLEQ